MGQDTSQSAALTKITMHGLIAIMEEDCNKLVEL